MKLLSQESALGITTKTWAGDGKIVTQTTSDAEKAFKKARFLAQNGQSKDFRHKATIDLNILNDAAYQASKSWGVGAREAFGEIMSQKSDRAKKLLRILTEGRDYRKFQAKNYL